MTIWHCNVAVSLDMLLARPDGSVEDWLAADYPPDDGFDAFLAGVDAILMGRATYDAVRGFGEWPYPGKPTVVLTHRALDDAPPGVVARGGDLAAVADEMESAGHRRVWIEGGGQVVRDMMRLGRLDVLEIVVIPIVLGEGIPLFPAGAPEQRLRLESAQPWIKGAMRLVYRRA
jgi:dihydrofolate reductase